MNCTVEQRNKARRVIQKLGDRPNVIGTDLVSPAIDPSGWWTIEIALDSDGLPPEIVSLLGDAEMTIRNVGPRQSWWFCVAELNSSSRRATLPSEKTQNMENQNCNRYRIGDKVQIKILEEQDFDQRYHGLVGRITDIFKDELGGLTEDPTDDFLYTIDFNDPEYGKMDFRYQDLEPV